MARSSGLGTKKGRFWSGTYSRLGTVVPASTSCPSRELESRLGSALLATSRASSAARAAVAANVNEDKRGADLGVAIHPGRKMWMGLSTLSWVPG